MGIKFSGSDAGGFRFDFSGANSAAGGSEGSAAPKRERKPRKAVGTPGKRIAINTLVTLLVGAVYFYLELPAINLTPRSSTASSCFSARSTAAAPC